MTDVIIFKRTEEDGSWEKYFLRKNGTIRYVNSYGSYMNNVVPDTLIGIIRLKKWYGTFYINVDALKKVTGLPYI